MSTNLTYTPEQLHRGSFADGQANADLDPEELRVGRFAEGESNPDAHPEDDHVGTFAEGHSQPPRIPATTTREHSRKAPPEASIGSAPIGAAPPPPRGQVRPQYETGRRPTRIARAITRGAPHPFWSRNAGRVPRPDQPNSDQVSLPGDRHRAHAEESVRDMNGRCATGLYGRRLTPTCRSRLHRAGVAVDSLGDGAARPGRDVGEPA